MSSTNRGRKQNTCGYYRTPVSAIMEFLLEFNKEKQIPWSAARVLDPCAGGDDRHSIMPYPTAIESITGKDKKYIRTIDIREDSMAEIKADYLEYNIDNLGPRPDVIITNPPFALSHEIIQKSLRDVADDGWVIMLLRLNYLEGQSRKPFWVVTMPQYIFVHSARMSFTDDGKTDSIAYAHYVFKKNNYPEFAKIKVI